MDVVVIFQKSQAGSQVDANLDKPINVRIVGINGHAVDAVNINGPSGIVEGANGMVGSGKLRHPVGVGNSQLDHAVQ